MTDLVDVWPRAYSASHKLLHEAGNLGHDVDPIESVLQAALNHSRHRLAILGLTSPRELDLGRLWPVVHAVALGFQMRGIVLTAPHDDLPVLGDNTYIHHGRTVRGWCGVLHQDGRVRRALEITKVPLGRGMVRLHSLQGMGEECLALEVDRAFLGGDGPLGGTSGPKRVAHGAPGVGQISAKQRLARFASHESWRSPLDGHVDDGVVVAHRLDCVCGSILGEFDCAQVIGVEGCLVLAELGDFQRCRGPEVGFGAVQVEDLAVELAGGVDAAAGLSANGDSGMGMQVVKRTPRYYK